MAGSDGGTSRPIAFHDQVNDEVELSRPLDRKIGELRPSKIFFDQIAGAPLKSIKATVPTRVENSYFS
jgi:hypothetical protein